MQDEDIGLQKEFVIVCPQHKLLWTRIGLVAGF